MPLTKRELAGFLGISERFIELKVNRGRLRAVRLSNRLLRFRPIDVERWMESSLTAAGVGVSAFRKGSDVTLDLDLGSIGIHQSRSSIRRLPLTPTRRRRRGFDQEGKELNKLFHPVWTAGERIVGPKKGRYSGRAEFSPSLNWQGSRVCGNDRQLEDQKSNLSIVSLVKINGFP